MELGNNEIWRAIDGYLNYDVSSHGRVRNNKTGRILKQQLKGRTESELYFHISLKENNIKQTHRIHRLVCFAFNENPNNYLVVDHIDRNKQNNFYQNLRWTTIEINSKNSNISKNNTSGIKGVYFSNYHNKWISQYCVNRKQKSKRFLDKDDAIIFRKEMEELHGYL
jgi:hypothetical protein